MDRINTQVIYRFALAQVECEVNVSLNNFKQNMTSLSILAGRTVHAKDLITFEPFAMCAELAFSVRTALIKLARVYFHKVKVIFLKRREVECRYTKLASVVCTAR